MVVNLFKFSCPACKQHIEAEREWAGRQINCPGCGAAITIPGAPSSKQQEEHAPPSPKPSAATPASTEKQGTPSAPPRSIEPASAAQDSKSPEPIQPGAIAAPAATALEQAPGPRTAILTPEIKSEIVRAVRRRIAEKSTWLPGMVGGKNAYAAKESDGQIVPVDVDSPEATRFSLVGAFLAELHERRVTATARGRRKLLDLEIVDAVRDVLLEAMSEEEREQADDSLGASNLMTLSHDQCLAVLALMEERYSERAEQARAEKIRRKLDNVRLSDLVKKLEDRAPVGSEEVATALFHELSEVRRRLDRLENLSERKK